MSTPVANPEASPMIGCVLKVFLVPRMASRTRFRIEARQQLRVQNMPPVEESVENVPRKYLRL